MRSSNESSRSNKIASDTAPDRGVRPARVVRRRAALCAGLADQRVVWHRRASPYAILHSSRRGRGRCRPLTHGLVRRASLSGELSTLARCPEPRREESLALRREHGNCRRPTRTLHDARGGLLNARLPMGSHPIVPSGPSTSAEVCAGPPPAAAPEKHTSPIFVASPSCVPRRRWSLPSRTARSTRAGGFGAAIRQQSAHRHP